jgi:hypothetical protein
VVKETQQMTATCKTLTKSISGPKIYGLLREQIIFVPWK